MPAFITHYIFVDKNKIENTNNIIYVFSQSHDYFYYNFNKNIRRLGHDFHVSKTQEYLINIIEYIKDKNLTENKDLLSYLYGSISHYVLDTVCHPYIFYKTGIYRKNDKSTYKYKGMHKVMERNIDAYMYEYYYKKKYNELNFNKEFFEEYNFSKKLINCVNYVYKKTYNIDNAFQYYLKGIKGIKLEKKLFFIDRTGIKNKIYNLCDKLFKTKNYCLSCNMKIDDDYLNLKNKKWNHPTDLKKEYTDSFIDLFNKSENEYKKIIQKIELYFNNKIDIDELKKYIPNISYTSGTLIEKKLKMQYFE